jgi:hypothetical protein|tara:strand:+ start:874 stop:1050 length:177 start_codon:yes stop_codon:yes gene_type:complete
LEKYIAIEALKNKKINAGFCICLNANIENNAIIKKNKNNPKVISSDTEVMLSIDLAEK